MDFLKEAGQSCWQILPLGPIGYGDSPYQSFSSFAGNPYYISLEKLISYGWLTEEECESVDWGADERYVDYGLLYENRSVLLRKAFQKSGIEDDPQFRKFQEEEKDWLGDFALFMALKDENEGKPWTLWEEDVKYRKEEVLKDKANELAQEICYYEFLQFEFYRQWLELKNYANSQGVEIIGDIPIYVSMDSADAWAGKELFQFDEHARPKAVAGCPPDGFSAVGQLWGNPLYDWDYHRASGFTWWMRRLRFCFRMYDVVRIDHFRGFDEYYAIPNGAVDAREGKWQKGPGIALFEKVRQVFGEREIIAEDLGYVTDSVRKLVAYS